ncbi:hypothetical protein GE09DRAFT_971688 [Coniochaeta sp. 2T2.1]|nr:hypothetical protein GE09DRAFT_971688 [Coniochaeta sp. 2T2.1]
MDLDIPIALRRTRRSLGAESTANSTSINHSKDLQPSLTATPSKKPKQKKRVRFSDPGPLLSSTTTPLTGLTPMIRRTTLATSRRHSTPARVSGSGLSNLSPFPEADEVVRITPLRQVLSGRVQRRIRRNGLSEEMNSIQAEKRQRLREEKREVERLRAEVEERDEEIARLRDETVVLDTERVWELEREVEELRERLAGRDAEGSGVGVGIESSPMAMSWTMAARDPYSDEYTTMDVDDGVDIEEFGDSSLAELACSTPSRRGRGMLATPPTTSPAGAGRSSPCTGMSAATPRSSAGVQVDLPDAEKDRMEQELASLHLELAKMTSTLEGYAGFAERVKAKLVNQPANDDAEEGSDPHPDIEARLATLLQTLSDRTAALLHLTSTISTLGFPGSDADEILRSIITAFRTARLELEYLTPGEVSLPLTSSGAAVLDLLLDRLRDLGRRVKEGDENIDEYHTLELSLRQQLSARVDVTDALTKEVGELKKKIAEREGKIEEQSVGLDRLKGAVASYARDVGELEELVGRLEGEKTAAVEELEERLAKQTKELEGKLTELEEKHSTTLKDMRKNRKEELAGVNKSHGAALALRDARVAELRGEIERVNASLRAAHETVQKLRVENTKVVVEKEKLEEENERLVDNAEAERLKAKEVVDGMRAELERVVRMSEGLFLSGDLAKRGGRKRRRYDSGLGFLDEEEIHL